MKIVRQVLDLARRLNNFPPSNLDRQLRLIAAQQSAYYVQDKMDAAHAVNSRHRIHDFAFQNIEIEAGLIMELGVFKGESINYLAKKTAEVIYGFDSFQGLPQHWRQGFPAGTFAVSRLPKVEKNVQLIEGFFDNSIPKFLASQNQGKNIAYLHIDCDLYSSTKTAFELLENRIIPGTIIVFDEYFNYPGWKQGEFAAFQDFIQRTSLRYSYLSYNQIGEQVAVKIL